MAFISHITNLKGQWITTKSIYLINSHKAYIYKECLKIFEYDKNNINNLKNIKYNVFYFNNNYNEYIKHHSQDILLNYIYKQSSNIETNYRIISQNNNKITVYFKSNRLKYYESIYLINNNFKIAFGVLVKNNKYIATMFTSYIKKSTSCKE